MLSFMDNGVQIESSSSVGLRGLLGPEWRVLLDVAVPDGSGDRDNLVVGPAGIVALTTRERPGATAWIGARSVTLDGRQTVFLQNARSHAERSAGLLAIASGRRVDVIPAVMLVGLAGFNVQHMPVDVRVTTDRRLRGWLASLPVRLEADEVEAIAIASARISH